jgi:hypothetical protein
MDAFSNLTTTMTERMAAADRPWAFRRLSLPPEPGDLAGWLETAHP